MRDEMGGEKGGCREECAQEERREEKKGGGRGGGVQQSTGHRAAPGAGDVYMVISIALVIRAVLMLVQLELSLHQS